MREREPIREFPPRESLGGKRWYSRRALAWIVFAAVLVGLGIWIGSIVNLAGESSESKYSAVYLATGDIYFGELSWFPTPHLKNAWLLQRGVNQQNQPQVSIAQFSRAFWGPAGDIYLNSKQIILWAKLRSDSQVVKAMENPASLQTQGNPSTQQQFAAPLSAVASSSPR